MSGGSDVLERILAKTRATVAEGKAARPFAALDREAREAPPPRGFARALEDTARRDGIALIAEIKKASPSGGLIRPSFDPAALARAYAAGGATCLSVLTDAPFFQGSAADLQAARAAVDLPVLRKDFMVDVWQMAEARAMGADCILLILAALDDAQARELHDAATAYGMDVLLETHDAEEMERALRLPSGLIGVNNRNLRTLKTDLRMTEELASRVPPDRLLVSESGIRTPDDVRRVRAAGARALLVGESLLRQEDVATAARTLLGS